MQARGAGRPAANRVVEHAVQQHRGRDRGDGRLRLGGDRYRAFAERIADGAAAVAGDADRRQYGDAGGAPGLERSGSDQALPRYRLAQPDPALRARSEEHTSELQSLMRNSYDVF